MCFLFLNHWLIYHVHCKRLADWWDYNQVFVLIILSDVGVISKDGVIQR